MKKWLSLAAVLLFLVVSTSAPTNPVALTDNGVRSVSDPMFETIIQGLEQGNYIKYSLFFSPALKLQLPLAFFPNTVELYKNRYGALMSPQYLGFLERTNHTRVLYKAQSLKLRQEVLIFLDIQKVVDPATKLEVAFLVGFILE